MIKIKYFYTFLFFVPILSDSELFQEWAAHEAYAETRRRVFIKTDNLKELWEKLHQHGESAMEEDEFEADGSSYARYRRQYR